MMVQQSQTPNHGKKYENNGKGGYFRLDDDNKMGYIIYFQSPKLEGDSSTHATPYITKKLIERIL